MAIAKTGISFQRDLASEVFLLIWGKCNNNYFYISESSGWIFQSPCPLSHWHSLCFCPCSLTDGQSIMTKATTSLIEKKLTKRFLRIHRSIIINIDHITAFNREWIVINELDLPISRKFKTAALERLSAL